VSLPRFLEAVRAAAGFLDPVVWTDSPHLNGTDLARSLAGADIWLTPAAVRDFDADDFVFLSPEERDRMADAVQRFRAVAEQVPGDRPATREQVEDALPAFLTILDVLKPYLVGPHASEIKRAVWQAWFRNEAWIPTFDFRTDVDWTGDPCVRVVLVLNDDVDVEASDVQKRLQQVRMGILKNFQQAKLPYWPYVSVRSRSETRELIAGTAP
jgi:hypothetical protein